MRPNNPFKGKKVDEGEFLFKYYTVAQELGISEATLYRWCEVVGVELARYGRGKHSPVYLSKTHVTLLWWRFVLARVSPHLPFPTIVLARYIFPLTSRGGGGGKNRSEKDGERLSKTQACGTSGAERNR